MSDIDAPASVQTYVERPPEPGLADLVAAVWVQEVAPGGEPYEQRHIPNGAVELVVENGSAPRVVGPLTQPLVETFAPGTTRLGIRFRPGAAPSALGLPASELVDLTVELDDLGGPLASGIEELDLDTGSPSETLRALQLRLAARRANSAGPDPLVAEAVRQLMPWQGGDVSSVSASLYISETQMRRRCRAAVGLAPKVLQRTLRFQGFLALVQQAIAEGRRPTENGLGALAADVGYADQPHLNRECVRLTGRPPQAFLGDTERSCACGHDHSASFAPMLAQRRPADRGQRTREPTSRHVSI